MAKFISMLNMSGYMPDRDPGEHDTKEDALSELQTLLEDHFEQSKENLEREYEGREKLPEVLEDLDDRYETAKHHLKTYGSCYFEGYFYGVEIA